MKLLRYIHILTMLVLWLHGAASSAVDEFAAALKPESCSVLVLDLKTGSVVAAHNDTVSLLPASITKCLTTATTLHESGKDYKYRTRVYMTGPVRDGILQGNLLIVGGGDPSLGADVEPRSEDICTMIVKALKKHNIMQVDGTVLTDCSIFPAPATPPSWAAGDLAHSYGTGCYGLNYRRNASGKSAVRNPQGVLTTAVAQAIAQEGISIGDVEIEGREHKKLLIEHVSPPIGEIMRSCMMRSDNLYAEALLRTYAMLRKKNATTEEAARLEMDYWKKKGAPMQGVNIVDGSGLSRSNRMTARFLAYVLQTMADDEEYASFFPLAGQEGTMRRMFKDTPLDSYVALKTGTMRGVRCLAGYMLDDNFAPTHVIVIMANDASSSAVNSAAQKLLLDIFHPAQAES